MTDSLYKRIGGYDAIAAITDDFPGKLVSHEEMRRFFYGASESARMRRRQHIVDFVCAKTGGPCLYTDRNMKDAHKGLGIGNREWNVLSELFLQSLKKYGLQPKKIEELMDFILSLRVDILEAS